MRKILAGTSQHAAAVRNCCRLAVLAENTREFGLAIVVGFGCLEGLLLSDSGKEDVVAKLSEAVVHSIARDFDEERALRRRVKHLYGIRSAYVHTGVALEEDAHRQQLFDLLYRVLRRKAGQLPDASHVADEAAT